MPNIIICANFGVKKLRGLRNTRGQILGSPIEVAHPYNSAALPCSLWWIYYKTAKLFQNFRVNVISAWCFIIWKFTYYLNYFFCRYRSAEHAILTSMWTKSNCPQGCNDCTKFAPIEQKYLFKLLHILLGFVMSLLLYAILVISTEFCGLERTAILFKLFHSCLVVFIRVSNFSL